MASDPHSYVTPWFRTERLEPRFEIPHVLRLGPEQRAEVLRDGAWREVYRGERAQPKALEGGRAVLLRAAAEIHREGTREVTRLPAEACGPWWPGHVAVPAGLERIVCVRASAERGCGRVVVTQFDTAGRQLRRDALGAPAVCSQVRANDDHASHWLGGLTSEGHPVLAVQVGVEPGKLRRYAIFVLEPQGPRELGRYTEDMPESEAHHRLWPRELSAPIAFPFG